LSLAVAATAALGADVLERLAAGHDVAFLLTRPDRPRGRGRRVGPPPAKDAALRLGIPVRQPERLDESFSLEGADTIVVAAYGALIPESLLGRATWLNVHPSLLPRWRGAAPVERAIMAGDSETGVTIHRTTPELDAGPIAAQRAFPIEPEDDAGAVYAKAGSLAAELLEDVLSGAPELRPQPDEGATYAERLTAEDRELDWSRPPEELLNRIRALSPHIGARGEVDGRRLTVWRARPARPEAALTAGGLELVEVQPEGRRRMSAEEYLRGLRG
jgi:methionyl-tRNA formyltransferase